MLNTFGFSLISAATVCLGGAGFIIHDLYDVGPKAINSPFRMVKGKQVSVKKAFRLFFILNILGVLIGFYLSNMVGYPSFAILFILTSALFYASAKGLKKTILVRPLIISFLGGISILSVGLFDLFPAITDSNAPTLTTFLSILKDFAVFFGFLLLIRELILGQKNIDSDHNNGWNTLSLQLGKTRTNQLIFVLLLLPLAAIIYYLYKYLYINNFALAYGLIFVLAPLLYVALKIFKTTTPKEFTHLQYIMSGVIFFSLTSLGLYQLFLS